MQHLLLLAIYSLPGAFKAACSSPHRSVTGYGVAGPWIQKQSYA